jgi:polyketide biosynthesis acyl carrier protein
MEATEIFNVLCEKTGEIMDMQTDNISMKDSLRELGANSMDRVDIIMETLEELDLVMPMVAFVQAKNIGDIVGVIGQSLD